MVRAKNCETTSTFVEVMQKKLWPLFFWTWCIYILTGTQKCRTNACPVRHSFFDRTNRKNTIVTVPLATLETLLVLLHIATHAVGMFAVFVHCSRRGAPDRDHEHDRSQTCCYYRQHHERHDLQWPRTVIDRINFQLTNNRTIYTVSEKNAQTLKRYIAQNYKDRFWWHLAKIFKIL